MKLSPWYHHPGVKTGDQLSRGERAADHMRNVMGSWPFVFGFIGAMILWAITNTLLIGHLLSGHAFDPYPYILLNLFLSMLAGLQGAILLIAAKRADAISAQQAMHHLELTEQIAAVVCKPPPDEADLCAAAHRLVAALDDKVSDHEWDDAWSSFVKLVEGG